MQHRPLGRTGYNVSTVGFGAWAIGGSWGAVNDADSMAALHRAVDLGTNFFDTADGYGGGHSEELLGRLRRERSEEILIATKAGRRLRPHTAEGYADREQMTGFVEASLRRLGVEALDLLQLHCPPTPVYYMPEVFGWLDDMVAAGKVRHYGVSVEKVEEGLKALEYPNVASVMIIYNIFRQRPADLFFPEAERRGVGVIVRVPLSSGMLTGKITRETTFSADDHRQYNREGQAFDRGETFSGVDFERQLEAVEALRPLVPAGMTMAQFALRWILMHEAVSCTVPGAKRPDQVEDNAAAADLPPLDADTMAQVRALYERDIQPLVHHYW